MSPLTEGGSYDQVQLEELRVSLCRRLGPYAADRLQVRRVLGEMTFELVTAVLAERLPTERIVERSRERIETARFATWWDHFKATYRSRWWMRWRRWETHQLVDEHVLEAVAVIDLSRFWAFPEAAVAAPELGRPVRFMQYVRHADPDGPYRFRLLP